MRLAAPFIVCLCIAATPSNAADWGGTQITGIINDVDAIKSDLIDDGKLVTLIREFHGQVGDFRDAHNGGVLADIVKDIVRLLQDRKADYDKFVDGLNSGEKCGAGSPCSVFRTDLGNFFDNVAALGGRFPVIERLGIDGSRAKQAIEIAPPFLLLALHNALDRIDGWQDIPADLRAVADEVGDDAFSDFMDPFSDSETEALVVTGSAGAFQVFERTPTQRVCERVRSRKDRSIDPIRLSRLQLFTQLLRTYLGWVDGIVDADIGADILGEGTDSLPSPVKILTGSLVAAFDMIQAAVQTRRANVHFCRDRDREIELQVAQCIWLADYATEVNIREAHAVVAKVIETAEDAGVAVDRAKKSRDDALNKINVLKYQQAYGSLCDAYQKIGT